MAKSKKSLDCVEIKNKIQRQLQDEFNGLTEDEKHRNSTKRILNNPILSKVYLEAKRFKFTYDVKATNN